MNIFNWVHQRPEQNLTESELINFSENYACKMRTEAQAYHFEGSPKKVTIHTEAFYTVHWQTVSALMSRQCGTPGAN